MSDRHEQAQADLTFALNDMVATTIGVYAVVHATADGLVHTHSGRDLTREQTEEVQALSRDIADGLAGGASSVKASGLSLLHVPFQHVQDVGPFDFSVTLTSPSETAPGRLAMVTSPAQGSLLVGVADDQCTIAILAQGLKELTDRVQAWWATRARAGVGR